MTTTKSWLNWRAWVLGFVLVSTLTLLYKQTRKGYFLGHGRDTFTLERQCVSGHEFWRCLTEVVTVFWKGNELLDALRSASLFPATFIEALILVSDCIPIPRSWHHGQNKHRLTLPVSFTSSRNTVSHPNFYSFYYLHPKVMCFTRDPCICKVLDMNDSSNHVTIKMGQNAVETRAVFPKSIVSLNWW